MSLKEVRPDIDQEIMQGWRASLHIRRQQKFKPVCVAVFPCNTEVVGGFGRFPIWLVFPNMHAVYKQCHTVRSQCESIAYDASKT